MRPVHRARTTRRGVLGSLLLVAPLLLGAPFLAGCQLFGESPPDPDWVEQEFSAASENVIWQVIVRSLTDLDYPVGMGVDPDLLVARSGWRRSLAPFKGRGCQHRAIVEVESLGEDRYHVRLRVQRQDNEAIVNPGDPRYAEWEWVPDDRIEARILLQQLRTYLDRDPLSASARR